MDVFPKIKDAIVGAIMGEAVNRSISFLVSKWRSPTEEERLRRLLLRVGSMVEEAEGRHITNQAMLLQLHTLRMAMHRGYYTLDTFRCPAPDQLHRGHSFALSNVCPAKRLRVGSPNEQQGVLASLEAAVQVAGPELATLSGGYPRLFRQPYSMYLLMDRCMFGRQMEMEHVVNFLLQAEADEQRLGVLPIVGPGKVGKSTLVHHACADERVRGGHFSRIVFFMSSRDYLTAVESSAALVPDGADHQRVLIIVELDGDVDEGSWKKLRSASERLRVGHGSKMLVTSRSDKIESLGTTLPLRLSFFTPETYWYFFKARIFGSADLTEHPKLVSTAMEIARELNGCFVAANIFRGILKSSMNPRFWSLTLTTFKEFRQKNLFLFSTVHPVDPWEADKPVHVPTPRSKPTSPPGGYSFVILGNYETASVHSGAEAPAVSVQDVLYGGARPQGKFNVLACTSHIPPHYSYAYNCEVRKPWRAVSRKKRDQLMICSS
ncbi:hypothetical protein BRADI_3g45550v3 [Brachypodium distachyon]|uniref:Uncharacterized protein n=2 Tax=Brachypodium distachyon TaxID=15368 RepID=I1IAF5_BRADI|nr:hypothetical protein BRADI_3g45550v3 [Brachypodium distachyon]